MGKIHILSTDNPNSKLIKYKLVNELKISSIKNLEFWSNVNIYITSDEEIKDKCHVLSSTSIGALYLDGVINTASMLAEGEWKKIILTTDPILIKYGVQAIYDEFLQWFVNNSSREEIEITKEMYMPQSNGKISDGKISHEISLNPLDNTFPFYKIIIPKEEPKQERMYSEEEMIATFHYGHQVGMNTILAIQSQHSSQPIPKPDLDVLKKEWFEQFKKKA